VAAAFAIVACAPAAPAVPAPRHHRIDLRNLAMQPALAKVAPGDTVTWANRDIVPHTVTADGNVWDSGTIEGGQQWSHVVTVADSAGYVCRFHAGMTARFAQR
jgi:plastocyanin